MKVLAKTMLALAVGLIVVGVEVLSGQVTLQQLAAQYYPTLQAHTITPALAGGLMLALGLLLMLGGIFRHVDTQVADHAKSNKKLKSAWDANIADFRQALSSLPNSATLTKFVNVLEAALFPSPYTITKAVGSHKKHVLTLTRVLMIAAGVYSIYTYLRGNPSTFILPVGGSASIVAGSVLDRASHAIVSGVSLIRNAQFLNKP